MMAPLVWWGWQALSAFRPTLVSPDAKPALVACFGPMVFTGRKVALQGHIGALGSRAQKATNTRSTVHVTGAIGLETSVSPPKAPVGNNFSLDVIDRNLQAIH
ncbi:MAG: hypothetical protein CMH56_01380 [Myxococcales bacterium]|nr:hypothetical protein [Myxococcales bacterium]|tara:strand:- start:1420 stop:1728 length:309 start_codon:yes stop_codon:yes gene_type:complete